MTDPLLRRLALDLDDGFPELLDAYGSMVVSLATRLTGPGTGEDLTQEVFLRAYRALAGYDRERILALALRPWLATITRNLARNEYRRRSRQPTGSPSPVDGDGGGRGRRQAASDDHHETEAIVDRLDNGAAVDRALDTLPPDQRDVVLLRYVAELSVREVADLTGHPAGTVKSHAARGLRTLRDELAELDLERP